MLGNRLVHHYRLGGAFCWFLALFLYFLGAVQSTHAQKPAQASQTPPFAQAPVKADTADQTNRRIAELALEASHAHDTYHIGVDDLLTVQVFEVPELSGDVRVNGSGLISIPLVHQGIQAAGLSVVQLQDELADVLESNGLVSHPQVSVRLKEVHSAPITVMGAVTKPGVIQVEHPTTLLEVISQAGGLAADAGNEIIVTRPPPQVTDAPGSSDPPPAPPETFNVNIDSLLDIGGSKYNIPVYADDVVRIPRAGVVYAMGAVNRPGGYIMQNDTQQLTVLKVLALAGGVQPTAKKQHTVILRKDALTGKQQLVPIDLSKILKFKSNDIPLEQSDILYVPDSAGLRALRRTGEAAISIGSGVALYRAVGVY